MSSQSARPRTRPGRDRILWGRAPVGVAPPACAPPPGSEKPGPPTRSSARGSCCSGLQIWPRCSPRRSTPWASCWCHRGPPLSISLLSLPQCHRGWRTSLHLREWSALKQTETGPLFCSVSPATSTLRPEAASELNTKTTRQCYFDRDWWGFEASGPRMSDIKTPGNKRT